MASAASVAVTVGGVTLVNAWVLKPMAEGGSIDTSGSWRVIPATAVFALALSAFEKVSPEFALGTIAKDTKVGKAAISTAPMLFAPRDCGAGKSGQGAVKAGKSAAQVKAAASVAHKAAVAAKHAPKPGSIAAMTGGRG